MNVFPFRLSCFAFHRIKQLPSLIGFQTPSREFQPFTHDPVPLPTSFLVIFIAISCYSVPATSHRPIVPPAVAESRSGDHG